LGFRQARNTTLLGTWKGYFNTLLIPPLTTAYLIPAVVPCLYLLWMAGPMRRCHRDFGQSVQDSNPTLVQSESGLQCNLQGV